MADTSAGSAGAGAIGIGVGIGIIGHGVCFVIFVILIMNGICVIVCEDCGQRRL
jgi:hypothetical protein